MGTAIQIGAAKLTRHPLCKRKCASINKGTVPAQYWAVSVEGPSVDRLPMALNLKWILSDKVLFTLVYCSFGAQRTTLEGGFTPAKQIWVIR